jgi:hypothetical protein
MAIKKQEFYEGAALHLLARTGQLTRITYEAPFFHMNDRLFVLLKYSTKNRSPWGFTFTPEEQKILGDRAVSSQTAIGLICGADGVAAFQYAAFAAVALAKTGAIHIACYRQHREFYEVNGPNGTISEKIAPSNWQRILEQ